MLQMGMHGLGAHDATIDDEGQRREVGLQAVRQLVTQRRHFAVFFGAQTFQPGVACMHGENVAARLGHCADKVAHKIVAFGLVDTDAVLHGDGHAGHIHHGLHAIGHQLGFGHQAGTECAALHALTRATAVQVDFVVAPLFTQPGAMRQVGWLAAAELQCHGVLLCIETQVASHIAMQQSTGGHHLGVQQGVAGQQPVKIAAMAVGPVEHRRNRHSPPAVQRACNHGQRGIFKRSDRKCPAGSRVVARLLHTFNTVHPHWFLTQNGPTNLFYI